MADTVSLSGLSKEVYEKSISEGVNNSFDLKEFFSVEEVDWKGGDGHVWTHHHSRNNSPFFAHEGGAYAEAGEQTHAKGRIGMKKIMGRIKLTEEGMEDLVSSEASFRNGMTDEKTRLIDDLARHENQALGMDGRGVLAVVDDTDPDAAGGVVSVDSPGNVPGDDWGNRFINNNIYIAFVNPATGQLRATTPKVSAVSSDGTSITVTGFTATSEAWADDDYIVHAANGSVTSPLDTSFEGAFWGLPALIDDGTNRDNYFGILRSQVESLQSYVVSSVGALSMDAAQRTSDVLYNKLGGIIDAIVMHTSTRREWLKITDADRRYTGSDLRNPDPSTRAFTQGDITVDDVKIKALKTIGLKQVFFLDTKKTKFTRYVAEPGKFMDRDGSMWARSGTGSAARHAYEATYFRRVQNHARNPGLCARWDGVTGQTLVVVRDL